MDGVEATEGQEDDAQGDVPETVFHESPYAKFATLVSDIIVARRVNGGEQPYILIYNDAVERIRQAAEAAFTFTLATPRLSNIVSAASARYVLPDKTATTCLQTNQTYAAELHVRMQVSTQTESTVIAFKACSIPVMVGSSLCRSLVDCPDRAERIRRYGHPGTLVSNGRSCMFVPKYHARNGPGRLLVRKPSRSNGHFVGIYIPLNASFEPTILNLTPAEVPEEVEIYLHIPGTKGKISLGLIFKALGVTLEQLKAMCPLLTARACADIWRSASFDVLVDESMTSSAACDEVKRIVSAFDKKTEGKQQQQHMSSLRRVLNLVYPDIVSATHCSVRQQKMRALTMLFQYTVYAIYANTSIINNLQGPVMYDLTTFVAHVDEQLRALCKKTITGCKTRMEAASLHAWAEVGIKTANVDESIASFVCGDPLQQQHSRNKRTQGRRVIETGGVAQPVGTTLACITSPDAIMLQQVNPHMQPGTVCMLNGPKSAHSERNRRTTLGAMVSQASDISELLNALTLDDAASTAVVVDGVCVGYTEMAPDAVVDVVAELRARPGSRMRYTTCTAVHGMGVVMIYAVPGRLCFYAFDLRKVRSMRPDELFDLIEGVDGGYAVELMVRNRVLCLLCDACTAQTHIAIGLGNNVLLNMEGYRYAIPSDDLAVSMGALMTNPFIPWQQAVRTIQATRMRGDQGFGVSDPRSVLSTGGLFYPQADPFSPVGVASSIVGADDIGYQNNAVMLAVPANGTDDEAVVFSTAFFQRGGLRVDSRIIRSMSRSYHKNEAEFRAALAHFRSTRPGFDLLDDDGIIGVGEKVTTGTVLFFDYDVVMSPTKSVVYVDKSVRHTSLRVGSVVGVTVSQLGDISPRFVRVTLSCPIPLTCLKCCIGPAKGVIGQEVRQEDLPFWTYRVKDANGEERLETLYVDGVITFRTAFRGTEAPFVAGATAFDYYKNPDAYGLASGQKLSPHQMIAKYIFESARKNPLLPENKTLCLYNGKTGLKTWEGVAMADVQVVPLRQIAAEKARAAHAGSIGHNTAGAALSGKQGGVNFGIMEMFADTKEGNPIMPNIMRAGSITVIACTLCGRECSKRSQDVHYTCPNGHDRKYITSVLTSANLHIFSTNAAACGICIAPGTEFAAQNA